VNGESSPKSLRQFNLKKRNTRENAMLTFVQPASMSYYIDTRIEILL
jgi:hypothetical protein